MHDNWIVFWSLLIASMGIAGLLYATIVLEPQLQNITDAREAQDGTMVRIQGTVQSVKTQNDTARLTLAQQTIVQVIVEESINLSKNDCLIIQGKKTSFRNEPQITATRIRRC
jgi:hypothetical protein